MLAEMIETHGGERRAVLPGGVVTSWSRTLDVVERDGVIALAFDVPAGVEVELHQQPQYDFDFGVVETSSTQVVLRFSRPVAVTEVSE